MIRKDLEIYLEVVAKKFGLEPALLVGLALAESEGNWSHKRFDKAYRAIWDIEKNEPYPVTAALAKKFLPPDDFPGKGDEWVLQKSALGPIGLMGAEARRLGYVGDLNGLAGHDGVYLGAEYLRSLSDKYHTLHGIEGVLSAYQLGIPDVSKNQEYVAKVVQCVDQYKQFTRR